MVYNKNIDLFTNRVIIIIWLSLSSLHFSGIDFNSVAFHEFFFYFKLYE